MTLLRALVASDVVSAVLLGNIDSILHTIQAKTRHIFQSKSALITSIGTTPHLICLIRHLLHPFLDFLWDFRVPAIEYAALVLTS